MLFFEPRKYVFYILSIESGKLVEQPDYIGMWTTTGGFQKDAAYTYMDIPRYFKIGTVSDDNKNPVVAKLALGAAMFIILYFFIYFTIKKATIATHLFVIF